MRHVSGTSNGIGNSAVTEIIVPAPGASYLPMSAHAETRSTHDLNPSTFSHGGDHRYASALRGFSYSATSIALSCTVCAIILPSLSTSDSS